MQVVVAAEHLEVLLQLEDLVVQVVVVLAEDRWARAVLLTRVVVLAAAEGQHPHPQQEAGVLVALVE
jgi:hypothetical protein